MKTVLEFEGESLVMTHPCQRCGIEIESGGHCQQCLIDFQMIDDEDCSECAGEGYVFDCIDGCCADADVGCDLCTTPCMNRNHPKPFSSNEAQRSGYK